MKLCNLKIFPWVLLKYYCPLCWYPANNILHEFQLLIEFPVKCAGELLLLVAIPGIIQQMNSS